MLKGRLYSLPWYTAMGELINRLNSTKEFTYFHMRSSSVWKICAPYRCTLIPSISSHQVFPPVCGRRSTTRQDLPLFSISFAVTAPNKPAPTIRKSYLSIFDLIYSADRLFIIPCHKDIVPGDKIQTCRDRALVLFLRNLAQHENAFKIPETLQMAGHPGPFAGSHQPELFDARPLF